MDIQLSSTPLTYLVRLYMAVSVFPFFHSSHFINFTKKWDWFKICTLPCCKASGYFPCLVYKSINFIDMPCCPLVATLQSVRLFLFFVDSPVEFPHWPLLFYNTSQQTVDLILADLCQWCTCEAFISINCSLMKFCMWVLHMLHHTPTQEYTQPVLGQWGRLKKIYVLAIAKTIGL